MLKFHAFARADINTLYLDREFDFSLCSELIRWKYNRNLPPFVRERKRYDFKEKMHGFKNPYAPKETPNNFR